MTAGERGGKRRILLCVTGGIAAYKTPQLVRSLVAAGFEVQVLATQAALAFVSELSLATVSGRPVRHTLLDAAEEGRVGHIELADWPDLVVVAPATANVLAAAAHGFADDLVTTCLLATQAPVLFAPAMNVNMWRHPATQANVATLVARGCELVGPDAGELACGWTGEGRMSDPERIVAAVQRRFTPSPPRDVTWRGKRVVVTAGPTRTYLDPVRFVTNASSGAMGFALAEAAARAGAKVVLVAGPVERATPAGVERIDVETADEMLAALNHELHRNHVDLVAMVAAVSDFRADRSPSKDAKDDLLLRLQQGALTTGVDVLATLTRRHASRTYFLGFGAQTVEAGDEADTARQLVAHGRRKLEQKGCHALFVNRVGVAGRGFGAVDNTGLLLLRRGAGEAVDVADAGPLRPKPELAAWILAQLYEPVRTMRA